VFLGVEATAREGVGVAVVVPTVLDGFEAEEFLSFGSDARARYKFPKMVWVVGEIPRNAARSVSNGSFAVAGHHDQPNTAAKVAGCPNRSPTVEG
jgi:hypothetical protein